MSHHRTFASFAVRLLALALATPLMLSTTARSVAWAETARTPAAPPGAAEDHAPPPRSIADITALLDQERPNAERIQRFRATAEQPVPAGADPARLVEFLYQRGMAAGMIGRVAQQLADFTEAVRIAEANPGSGDLALLLQRLSIAEYRSGHKRLGIKARERYVQAIEASNERAGRLISAYGVLATSYAEFGDLAQADQLLKRLKDLLATLRSSKRYAEFGTFWESWPPLVEATLAERSGRMRDAEQAYRRHLTLMVEAADHRMAGSDDLLQDNVDRARVRLAVRVLVPQGRLLEAEVLVRRALLSELKRRGRFASETADILEPLAEVLAEQGRTDDAIKLARATIEIYEKTGHGRDSGSLARARMRLGGIQGDGGRTAEALATFDGLERDLASNPELKSILLEQNPQYAAALQAGGRFGAAVATFERVVGQRANRYGADHPRVAFLRGQLALAQVAAGNREAALANFRAALPALTNEGAAQAAAIDEEQAALTRQSRRQAIIDGYIGLLAERIGASADPSLIAEAFQLADAARGQAVQKAVAAAAVRVASGGGELAELVRREQDAGAELAAHQALIADQLASSPDQRDAGVIKNLSSETADLAAERGRLRQDLQRRFPRYAELRNPSAATVTQVQAAMRPNEALLAMLVGERQTLVWAVPARGTPAFAAVPLSRAQAAAMVETMRRQLDPGTDILAGMPVYDLDAAHKLYQTLLRPVEAGWRGAKTLLVVPDKAFGQLPFAVLVTEPYRLPAPLAGEPLFAQYRGVPWLVRKAAIVQLPSVNALVTLRTATAASPAPKPFLGFGDPWFTAAQADEGRRERGIVRGGPAVRGGKFLRRASPRRDALNVDLLKLLPRLPETADEVRGVALALHADPDRDVILGEQANEETVTTMRLDDRRVVMFATHGLIPGDLPGLSQPALALTAPGIAGLRAGTGLLTLDRVLTLKLNAEWVVLSACNTAAGAGAGAEAVSGLGRAFFYAGTRALLVTQWPVESTSAAALTTGTFAHQAAEPGLSRAEALRLAELDLIAKGVFPADGTTPVFSYAHPAFWAPYTLVGDGG